MKVVVADDAGLIRAGIVELLRAADHEVVGEAADADELRALIDDLGRRDELPDLMITDVRMPPDKTDDGLRAAIALREKYPHLPVLVLSLYVSGPYVRQLMERCDTGAGLGYLLKERVGQVSEFMDTLDTVAGGGMALDPQVVSYALRSAGGPLQRLTPREREVLQLMAEGLSNNQIAKKLVLSQAAVSKHVAGVFTALDMPPEMENRRVRAVLAWLKATS